MLIAGRTVVQHVLARRAKCFEEQNPDALAQPRHGVRARNRERASCVSGGPLPLCLEAGRCFSTAVCWSPLFTILIN